MTITLQLINKIIILLFLSIYSLAIFPQKLTIESMKAVPMDLSAVSKTVNDINSNPCGLVKVQLVATGAKFGGNIISPVNFDTGEYWVYMTAGSYMLKIRHPNYLPLDVNFRDFGIQKVEPKVTYQLTIIIPQSDHTVVDDVLRYLILSVTPQNAIVYVDVKAQIVNIGKSSVLVSKGTHSYKVEAVGYDSKSGTVDVIEGRKTLSIDLLSKMAHVSVTCPTVGAEIYINEELKWQAPWKGQLLAGNYQIEARLAGYRSLRNNIVIGECEEKNLNCLL